jgi:hypothetical protein
MFAAGVGTGCHANQTHLTHQSLDALAIDAVPLFAQEDHHATGAIERMACVFLVNESAVQQIQRINGLRLPLCINGRARYASQRTLANDA